MRHVALSMVKNEDDFIESFVRLNARNIDRFLIVDDASTDRTLPILSALAAEGFDIQLYKVQSERMGLEQQQGSILGSILAAALDTPWDFAFLLDADEVLLADRARTDAQLARLGPSRVGRVPWVTHVPLAADFAGAPNPAKTLFRPLRQERVPYYKAVIPRAAAAGATILPGNHAIARDGRMVDDMLTLDLPLGHFPVRHADQVVAKALVGNHKLSIKTNRLQGEGYHWDQLAERLRANGFALPLEELQRIAAAYPLIQHAADAPPPLGEPSDLPDITLRYPVARTSALARLDAFVLELCRDYRGRPTGAAR